MKTPLFCLLSVVITVAAQAADPIEIKNGDFEKGKQFWRGDGKVVTLPEGGKVCELKASERYNDEITQEVDFGKNGQAEITLRMKSSGLKISMKRRDGGYTYFTRPVPPDGSWGEFKWKFDRATKDEKLTLILSPSMGKGSIQVDDVKVTATGSTSPNLQ